VLDVVCVGAAPAAAELLRLKDVTVELVAVLTQELQANRNLWSPHKRPAQEALAAQLFDHLMRLRPPLVDAEKADLLAEKLLHQAKANHDKLVAL
jgi:type I restriction enzyme R subunit